VTEAPGVRPLRRYRIGDTVIVYGLIALGTAIGGVLRALVSLGMLEIMDVGLPWGTLLVNAVGSFVIGFYATLAEPGGLIVADMRQRHFVMTGLCGGFTTFSLFSLETLRLAQLADWTAAATNVAAAAAVWLVAVWLGFLLAARMNR
jgi:fluoride exporter